MASNITIKDEIEDIDALIAQAESAFADIDQVLQQKAAKENPTVTTNSTSAGTNASNSKPAGQVDIEPFLNSRRSAIYNLNRFLESIDSTGSETGTSQETSSTETTTGEEPTPKIIKDVDGSGVPSSSDTNEMLPRQAPRRRRTVDVAPVATTSQATATQSRPRGRPKGTKSTTNAQNDVNPPAGAAAAADENVIVVPDVADASVIEVLDVSQPAAAGATAVQSHDDDDVVLVSASAGNVIDLCSPAGPSLLVKVPRPRREIVQMQFAGAPTNFLYGAARAVVAPQQCPRAAPYCSVNAPPKLIPAPPAELDDSQHEARPGATLRCPVCLDAPINPVCTKCGHIFCQACIMNSMRVNTSCPMCKKKISKNTLVRIFI